MSGKIAPLVYKNLFRSKTRLLATVGGCAIGAFIVCFFLAADSSLERMKRQTQSAANLIMTQQDRF